KVPREVPDLKIPRNGAQSVDIYPEAYAPIAAGDSVPRRVAVGSLLGVPLISNTISDLRLYPDERVRLLIDRLARPLAFHTPPMRPWRRSASPPAPRPARASSPSTPRAPFPIRFRSPRRRPSCSSTTRPITRRRARSSAASPPAFIRRRRRLPTASRWPAAST